MKALLKIINLSYSYNSDTLVLNNVSFDFKFPSISIIGTSSSGKTTLAKILSGDILAESILIDNVVIKKDKYALLNKTVGVVTTDLCFISENVYNELAFGLENQNCSLKLIKERVNELAEFFNISDLLKDKPDYLSYQNQILVKILSYLIMNVKIIVIDSLLSYLDNSIKKQIFSYTKNHDIQIINITSNIEDILFTDYVYVLHKGKIVIEGNLPAILGEEKIMKRLGLYLPTIADISLQLKCYNLINKIYLNEKELVDELWK